MALRENLIAQQSSLKLKPLSLCHFLVPYEVPVAEESTCKYTLLYSYTLSFLSVVLKLRFEKICKEIIRLASWHQNHVRARNHFAVI